jgi:hypothetical protein
MTAEDLEKLVQVMRSLEEVAAEIKTVRVGAHEVHLDRIEDHNNTSGVSYIVRGITDKPHAEPAYRDSGSGMTARSLPGR